MSNTPFNPSLAEDIAEDILLSLEENRDNREVQIQIIKEAIERYHLTVQDYTPYLNKIVWVPDWNFKAKVIQNNETDFDVIIESSNGGGINWGHLYANQVNPKDLKILGNWPEDKHLLDESETV